MARLSPEQRRTRERVESAIRLMAPALDLVLMAGERLSRIVEREDSEYYPPRSTTLEPPPASPEGQARRRTGARSTAGRDGR